MKATIFTDYELFDLNGQTQSIRDKKIRRRFKELCLEPSYLDLSTEEKLDWLNSEVAKLDSKIQVSGPLIIFGLFVATILGIIVGGIAGFILFLIILGFCCAIGTKHGKEEILRPYLKSEIAKMVKVKNKNLAKEE